jgi:hypothetical protein
MNMYYTVSLCIRICLRCMIERNTNVTPVLVLYDVYSSVHVQCNPEEATKKDFVSGHCASFNYVITDT